MNMQLILLSQYPALFLLSLLFLLGYFIARKKSAFKSFLWVLLFAVSLAAGVVCCFWGLHEKYWALSTLFRFSLWSWLGLALVLIVLILRIWHGIEVALNRRKLNKAMKNAEKEKEAEVRRARAEAAAEERARVLAETAASEPIAPETVFPSAAEASVEAETIETPLAPPIEVPAEADTVPQDPAAQL